MKKLLPLVILLSIEITQIYAQCYQCDSITKAFTIGTNTIAIGDNAFVGGYFSKVLNNNGFAFGNYANVFQADGIAIGNFVTSDALNSYVFGMGSSGLPLTNDKPNSIMFGVNEFPSLTIHKPTGATMGYLGIGTDEPEEMAHVVGTLLIDRTEETASSLQFKHPNTRGDVGPGSDSLVIQYAPHYWDIYSDPSGLKFNTIASNGNSSHLMFIGSNGRVGIGTTTPFVKLHVNQNILAEGDITTYNKFILTPAIYSSEYWEISRTSTGLKYGYYNRTLKDVLFMGNDGSIGIGKTNPTARLDVNGSLQAVSATINGALTAQSANISGAITADGALTAKSANINGNANITGTLDANALTANSATITGNATITGTLTANLLSAPNANINGKIKAKEVEVTLSDWPDFVFETDYKLMPLNEVEQYIAENQHLPNVPSAAEVEANGVNLGEMNNILIQKIEELTLYILDLQNQINELKKQ